MASAGGVPVEIEEDDELFEIDLNFANSIITAPPHFSDEDSYGFFTATGGAALLANCLLPISDLSNAVPMADSGECEMFPCAAPPDFDLGQALFDRLVMKISRR